MRIACVHQGYELYGSDRSFVESVAAIRKAYPAAEIEVVLPRDGPIVAPLKDLASRIVFEPIWVLRRRNLVHLATVGLMRLPGAVLRAARRLRSHDLTYINTSVIACHILAARAFPGRAVLHVHEIPEGSTLTILRGLVSWSRAEIIFNSRATAAVFPLRHQRAQVIYNGVAGPAAPEPTTYDGQRRLRVLLLGRVNRIKGQEVLVEAVRLLDAATRDRLEVRMVGSAFEDPAREQDLHALVREAGLAQTVSVEPFTADAAPLYRWADIVTVPSRRPESLGRVAIEAMAFGRPVIASDIGGLAEIIEDGRTGRLMAPNSPQALARALESAVAAPSAWKDFGQAGRARYEALFSEAAAGEALGAVIARIAAAVPARAVASRAAEAGKA